MLRISSYNHLTHWGWVTHICVNKLTIIGSDNGLSPGRRQAIIWTSAGILLIGPLGTNFSEILIKTVTFSFKKMHLKVSSAKRRPFGLGLNALIHLGWPHTVSIYMLNCVPWAARQQVTSVTHIAINIDMDTCTHSRRSNRYREALQLGYFDHATAESF